MFWHGGWNPPPRGSPRLHHSDLPCRQPVESVDNCIELGFPVGDGLVEGGDFGVKGKDAVAERRFGGGAEGEEEFEEAFGVEGLGDVEALR